MNVLGNAWKAIVAFIAPAAVVIGSSVLATSDGGSSITQAEIVTAIVAAIVSSSATYMVPPGKNLKTPPK